MSARLRKKLSCRFWKMRRVAVAILREIFDEAAYERFLMRHRQGASAETYAAFRRDHEALNLRRPRCC